MGTILATRMKKPAVLARGRQSDICLPRALIADRRRRKEFGYGAAGSAGKLFCSCGIPCRACRGSLSACGPGSEWLFMPEPNGPRTGCDARHGSASQAWLRFKEFPGIRSLRIFLMLVLSAVVAACASATPQAGDESRYGANRAQKTASAGRVDTRAQRCVALAMYWEARGEGREGMLAVGSVVLNRVADRRFPNSVCGVVYEGGETPPCQFSWWCDGKSDRPTQEVAWSESLGLAYELLAARPKDPTDGALFFHNTSVRPSWRRERTARIGDHVFYR